jgi:ADP-heptose:LPS heptosyltransferase
MESILNDVPQGARVVVIRLRSLGDCVLTTPALAILKSYRPDLQLGVVVDDRFRAVFEGNPDVDAILGPEVSSVMNYGGQLCLNLHGGSRSALLTVASRARFRAGFGHYRLPAAYNLLIPRAQQIFGIERPVHTAEHLASAMFYLGVPVCEIPKAKLSAAPARRSRPYAVLHPFASHPNKTWPAERFQEVARSLSDDLKPVFIAGPGDDPTPFCDWQVITKAPLQRVISVISAASLFIGNDSGPAHIAAGFGVPSAVIFGASDPAIWGPWRVPSKVICHPDGIAAVPARTVLDAVEALRVKA